MRRPSGRLTAAGENLCWLGANFWSRSGGPLMWRNYQPDLVREELTVLRDHGLGVTRSFFYWPDFHPEPDRIDEQLVERFADFLDAHHEVGMSTIPTFLVGHMSGENWDPAWRAGRDLYADVWMVDRQAWFVERMTARFHQHPAVAAWLISNEMPIYGRQNGASPAPRAQVTAWARLMLHAVRAGGATQPVSFGDGAWGIEVSGRDNGFSVRETGALADFVGPHIYRMETDRVRQHLNAAFECELAAVAGKPVILEEFGLSTDFVSTADAGHYYRQQLHNSLLGGATGWLAWNNTDYDQLWNQDPYRHHPFEMHFGITDHTGRPKEPLRELAAFSDTLRDTDLRNCRREDTTAALVVPSFLERDYPISRPVDRPLIFTALRQGYVAAREADLPVAFLREEDGLACPAAETPPVASENTEGNANGDTRLYLLPSTRQLLAPTRRQLEQHARDGAVVYLSYCSGEHAQHRGPWFQDLDGLFGVRLGLSYGMVDPVEDDEVELRFEEDFGTLRAGEVLRFTTAGNENSRAYLPVEPDGARVVARDAHGRPALLRYAIGAGETVLCTYPLEHMAACLRRINPENSHRLYAALARVAGVHRPVTVDNPLVHCDTVVHSDGRRFVWLVGQNDTELAVAPRPTSGVLRPLHGGEPVTEVRLAPYGVTVLENTANTGNTAR